VPGEASVVASTVGDEPALTLAGADGALQATFLPGLGMVGCSLLHDGDRLLELRGGPAAYAERGSSFGIPLLHPWANRLGSWSYTAGGRHVEIDPGSPLAHTDGATGLPMHGLLTASPDWTVTDTHADADTAAFRAELDFAANPALLAAFPFPHRLEFHVAVRARRLTVRLILTPTASDPVPISFGFHPYLRLPGSDRRTWAVDLPVLRRAVFDDRGIPIGVDQPIEPGALSGLLGDRVFDDSFDRLGPSLADQPVVFSVADDRRQLAIEFTRGYDVAHVFAPTGSSFICFEPMTAPVDALSSGRGLRWVEPGASFVAEFAITVTPV
jgi:galactose mutarotase-like enzyme